jgi:hypothetical protein
VNLSITHKFHRHGRSQFDISESRRPSGLLLNRALSSGPALKSYPIPTNVRGVNSTCVGRRDIDSGRSLNYNIGAAVQGWGMVVKIRRGMLMKNDKTNRFAEERTHHE